MYEISLDGNTIHRQQRMPPERTGNLGTGEGGRLFSVLFGTCESIVSEIQIKLKLKRDCPLTTVFPRAAWV